MRILNLHLYQCTKCRKRKKIYAWAQFGKFCSDCWSDMGGYEKETGGLWL